MSTAHPTIAILDDEACIRTALERLLRSAGYHVRSYANPIEFLTRISTERPDILLLDLRMPELDGFEVMNALKNVQINLPTIVLTAEYSPLAQEKARAAGALAFLIKPVNDRDLFEVLSLTIIRTRLPRST